MEPIIFVLMSDSAVKVAFSRLKAIASYLQLRIILEVLQLLHWMDKLKQLLCYFYGGIFGALVVV
uniref:Putative aarF domain-containing protein kinase 1-like n=1 Tax=Rhizophora mucronata TaxID=61149 RepID=A0A2P2NYW0_RHIMU